MTPKTKAPTKLKKTLKMMDTYLKAIEADVDIDEDEMWLNIKKALEDEVGEKMPEPTFWQNIKWSFIGFIQNVWWDIKYLLTGK